MSRRLVQEVGTEVQYGGPYLIDVTDDAAARHREKERWSEPRAEPWHFSGDEESAPGFL